MKYDVVLSNIRKEFKAYLQCSGLKSVVLGISGGIDSALTVAIAKPVCDELGVKIVGRFIEIGSNKQDEIDRGDMCGAVFCHDYANVNLTETFGAFAGDIDGREGIIGDDIADKIRLGNVKARMRMIYLYNLAQMNGGMVLSTDNYTELLLGFWTLHGDVGDYGMIQNLWKMEVYGLATWIAVEEGGVGSPVYNALMACIQATPTDGLGITSSDVEQLGAKNYQEVDNILQSYIGGDYDYEQHKVVQRMKNTNFKRENPYNLPREVICKGAM